MKRIAELVAQIDEELEGAKGYAEYYLDRKASNDSQWSSRYKEMATDELKHAGFLHDLAIAEIDKLKAVYNPPVEMEEQWNVSHKKYMERAAWIRMMLAM